MNKVKWNNFLDFQTLLFLFLFLLIWTLPSRILCKLPFWLAFKYLCSPWFCPAFLLLSGYTLSLDDLIHSNRFSCHLSKFQVDRTANWHYSHKHWQLGKLRGWYLKTGHPNTSTQRDIYFNKFTIDQGLALRLINSGTLTWHCQNILNNRDWCIKLVCQNMSYQWGI